MKKVAAGRVRSRWQFRLYVAGRSLRGATAYANLKRLCDEQLGGRYSIEVVDVLERPALAGIDNIVAIPTLVRRRPKPVQIAVGDFSATGLAVSALRLEQSA